MSAVAITPTPQENLYIWRRRKNMNQVEAADALGVTVDRYRAWETGEVTTAVPYRNAGKLSIPEKCVLLRRRAGLTQREIAETLGCTRLWVNHMEKGTVPVDRLQEHWGV